MTHIRSNSTGAILRRRAPFILAMTALGGTLAGLSLSTVPPRYTATAQILFSHADEQTLHTHKEAIRSLIPAGHQDRNLDVTLAGRASILNVHYTDASAQTAAEFTNTLAKSYIEKYASTPQMQANRNTDAFLKKLKINIDDAQTALALFEEKAAKKARAPSKKAHESYEQAKRDLEKAQNDITPFLKKDGHFTINPNAPSLRNAPSLEKLREKQRDLTQKHTALSTRYGPKHPEMRALAASMTVIDTQILEESTAILETLKTNYALAKTRIKNLEDEGMRTSLKQEAERFKQYQEKLNLLKSRVTEAQSLYNTFNDVQQNAQTQNPNEAKLLRPAIPPYHPSFPNIPALTSLASLLSALLAAAIAILQERKNNGFTSARQIEESLDLQCFSLIPEAKADKNKPIANYVLDNPASPIAEAVRTLKLNIKLHTENTDNDCKVICLTSTLAGEGKTTLATWIARLASQSGQRTILIDADIRRPSVHLALGKRSTNSLADYLSGTKKREDVIDTTDTSGLHVIYGRAVPNSAIDMISSEKMDTLIRNLRGTYDLIIIDTPASMAVPDARALEKRSDLFLYCIAWNKTPRPLIHNGIAQFRKFSNPMISTVLTQIDPKKHVQLGYGMAENEYEDYKAL